MFLENYKRAVAVIVKKPIMLWGLSLLLGVVSMIATLVTISIPVVSIAIGYLFTCGAVRLYMDGLKGKEVNSKQLFFAFNKNCVRTAGAIAWRDLWIVIWALVPIAGPFIAIYKAYSYRFVPYIIVSNSEISAFDALKISMKMTQGKKGAMFLADIVWLVAVYIAFFILGLFSAIPVIGFLFSLVIFVASLAVGLFGSIFTGLVKASFFNEEEVPQYLEASAEEVVAAAVAE